MGGFVQTTATQRKFISSLTEQGKMDLTKQRGSE